MKTSCSIKLYGWLLILFLYFLKILAYPCLSSGIVSSISAMLSRLNPPTLKLMPAEDLLLKFPPLSVNPCKSNVPNGFFVFTLASFRFNVRFWRNRLPPGAMKEKVRGGEKFQFIFRFVKLNENCFLMLSLFVISHSQSPSQSLVMFKTQTNSNEIFWIFNAETFFLFTRQQRWFFCASPLSPFFYINL